MFCLWERQTVELYRKCIINWRWLTATDCFQIAFVLLVATQIIKKKKKKLFFICCNDEALFKSAAQIFFITENLIETTNYIHLNRVKLLHLEEKIIGQKKTLCWIFLSCSAQKKSITKINRWHGSEIYKNGTTLNLCRKTLFTGFSLICCPGFGRISRYLHVWERFPDSHVTHSAR